MADPKDIKKSVEDTVNQILSAGDSPAANGGQTQAIEDPTAAAAAVSKAAGGEFPVRDGAITSGSPEAVSANGGRDRIKNDSPLTTEEAMYGEKKKKADEAKKALEEATKALADAEAELAKAGKPPFPPKKDDDADDKKKKEDEDKAKKAYPQPPKGKMKKSIDDLKEHLDEDELELVKTWREECDKDPQLAKSQEAAAAQAAVPANIEEVLKKAVADGTADLRKAIDEKDTLIKGLSDKIEKMASQPAYDRRSISTLETLEKSGASDPTELKKSQVLDKMLELQAAGKGITSHHVAEFEATNNISDPAIRGMIFRELKVN